MVRIHGIRLLNCVLVLCTLVALVGTSRAGNEILGELQLKGASGVEKDSGVWVDGQYLGYLRELKGSKKVLLLPGEHEVLVRQAGYHDFSQQINLAPGEKQTVRVRMRKDANVHYPSRKVTAEIQLNVAPDRAAVFVDGLLIGHVAEFQGARRALLVAPGKRKITISLPGYQTFETVVNLAPRQKFKIMTSLIWNGATETTAQR
jgi:PEGA domain